MVGQNLVGEIKAAQSDVRGLPRQGDHKIAGHAVGSGMHFRDIWRRTRPVKSGITTVMGRLKEIASL